MQAELQNCKDEALQPDPAVAAAGAAAAGMEQVQSQQVRVERERITGWMVLGDSGEVQCGACTCH
jgi:hypothetical protein